MVFGLGFFTAGLLALACLPAVWRRALRLTIYRLRQLVPLSADEIAADRAGLRAQFAVEQRRLEQRIAEGETSRSDLMAELGRRDAALSAMTETAARDGATIAELRTELDAAQREVLNLAGQMSAANLALHELEGLAERRLYDAGEARREVDALQGRLHEDRASIAAFETRVLGLDTRVADLGQALDKVTADLVRTAATERQVTAERDAARQAAETLAGKRDLLASSGDRLQGQLTQEKERTAEAARRATDRTQAAAAQAETMADLRAQLSMQREAAQASAARIEEMRAEAAVRSPAVAREADLDALREAIRKVADDVLKLTTEGPSPAL
jgi:chromosome segregation ATPase